MVMMTTTVDEAPALPTTNGGLTRTEHRFVAPPPGLRRGREPGLHIEHPIQHVGLFRGQGPCAHLSADECTDHFHRLGVARTCCKEGECILQGGHARGHARSLLGAG